MRYYDDLNVGSGWLVGTYVASRAEAIELATRWEPQPYHVDERAAAESVYGGLTLCSLHLFATNSVLLEVAVDVALMVGVAVVVMVAVGDVVTVGVSGAESCRPEENTPAVAEPPGERHRRRP